MTDFYNFGDYVFPVCRLHLNELGKYNINHFHGSGFFIGGDGYFLSAKHVINSEDIKEITEKIAFGLILQNAQDNGLNRFVKIITHLEEHPEYDIVIGKVDHTPEIFFSSENQDAYGWEDVHCFGYPDDLNKNHEQKYAFGSQFLKGYIMRRISTEDLPFLNIPPSYELDFPIPKGISGSPIFRIGAVKSLLGIALASHDSVLSRYESTEILDGNETYSEKTVQVKQVGIAARAFDIRDWKPSILNGLALKDVY